MALDHNDLESIERIVSKAGDDIAVSLARGFERLDERIDAAETRIYGSLADIEDRLECRGAISASDPEPLDE